MALFAQAFELLLTVLRWTSTSCPQALFLEMGRQKLRNGVGIQPTTSDSANRHRSIDIPESGSLSIPRFDTMHKY